jgi:hypothetical protein
MSVSKRCRRTCSHVASADLKRKVISHFRDPLPDGTKVVDASLIERCQSGF